MSSSSCYKVVKGFSIQLNLDLKRSMEEESICLNIQNNLPQLVVEQQMIQSIDIMKNNKIFIDIQKVCKCQFTQEYLYLVENLSQNKKNKSNNSINNNYSQDKRIIIPVQYSKIENDQEKMKFLQQDQLINNVILIKNQYEQNEDKITIYDFTHITYIMQLFLNNFSIELALCSNNQQLISKLIFHNVSFVIHKIDQQDNQLSIIQNNVMLLLAQKQNRNNNSSQDGLRNKSLDNSQQNNNNNNIIRTGYLSMDNKQRIIPLTAQDEGAYKVPLIGIWIQSDENVNDIFLWTLFIEYAKNGAMKKCNISSNQNTRKDINNNNNTIPNYQDTSFLFVWFQTNNIQNPLFFEIQITNSSINKCFQKAQLIENSAVIKFDYRYSKFKPVNIIENGLNLTFEAQDNLVKPKKFTSGLLNNNNNENQNSNDQGQVNKDIPKFQESKNQDIMQKLDSFRNIGYNNNNNINNKQNELKKDEQINRQFKSSSFHGIVGGSSSINSNDKTNLIDNNKFKKEINNLDSSNVNKETPKSNVSSFLNSSNGLIMLKNDSNNNNLQKSVLDKSNILKSSENNNNNLKLSARDLLNDNQMNSYRSKSIHNENTQNNLNKSKEHNNQQSQQSKDNKQQSLQISQLQLQESQRQLKESQKYTGEYTKTNNNNSSSLKTQDNSKKQDKPIVYNKDDQLFYKSSYDNTYVPQNFTQFQQNTLKQHKILYEQNTKIDELEKQIQKLKKELQTSTSKDKISPRVKLGSSEYSTVKKRCSKSLYSNNSNANNASGSASGQNIGNSSSSRGSSGVCMNTNDSTKGHSKFVSRTQNNNQSPSVQLTQSHSQSKQQQYNVQDLIQNQQFKSPSQQNQLIKQSTDQLNKICSYSKQQLSSRNQNSANSTQAPTTANKSIDSSRLLYSQKQDISSFNKNNNHSSIFNQSNKYLNNSLNQQSILDHELTIGQLCSTLEKPPLSGGLSTARSNQLRSSIKNLTSRYNNTNKISSSKRDDQQQSLNKNQMNQQLSSSSSHCGDRNNIKKSRFLECADELPRIKFDFSNIQDIQDTEEDEDLIHDSKLNLNKEIADYHKKQSVKFNKYKLNSFLDL